MSRPQRNTLERQMALEDRAENQRNRVSGRVWRFGRNKQGKRELMPEVDPALAPERGPHVTAANNRRRRAVAA